MIRHILFAALTLGLHVALSGCGESPPEMGQVEGVVTVKGKPLSRLAITFMPEASADGKQIPINASAETDEQGKYQLKHFFKGQQGDGAPVGWNRVVIEDLRQSHLGQGQARPPQLIPFDLNSPTTTPLRKEVKPGAQTIDLELNE